MALTVNLSTSDIGIPVQGAYLRLTKVEANKTWVRLDVEAHVNLQAKNDGKSPIFRASHALPPEYVGSWKPSGLYTALYAFLKTLPEYSGAKDC